MKYKIYLLFVFIFLLGCESKKEETKAPTASIPQIAPFSGGSLRITTSDSPKLIESISIFTDSNSLIPDGTQFQLVSDVVLINSENSSNNSTWSKNIIVSSLDGKISFYVKPHTITGLYRVNAYPVESSNIKFDQGLNARYFINVVSGVPTSLGDIKTDVFEDKSPYNNVKDLSENWIVTSNPDLISYIQVGPVVDVYGNLVDEGNLDLNVSSGNIISENPTRIISGYSYFSYKSNGTNGSVNVSAQIINHPLNTSFSLNSQILKTSPSLTLTQAPDFTGMLVGATRCETVELRNVGGMVASNLNFESSFPFNLIEENNSDTLCPLTADVCKLHQNLRSGESCKLRVKLTMPNNSLSDGDLTVQAYPQEFPTSLLIQKLRTQSVQAAQLVASNPFISFGGTQCSTTRTVDITVENIGDFDATGLVVQNPPPNNNQSNPFYSIILPPMDIPMNPNMNSLVNCGTTFPAGRKCRVQISFNPTAGILSQALTGKILGENINPLILSVSGYTVPGSGLSTFPINFVTPNNSLLPLGMFIANGQQTRVDVGPIVDACNQRVADGSILTASVTAGSLNQSTLVSNNGFVSFYWNSGTDISKIGTQNISVSVGVNGSKNGNILFKGVDLQLSGSTNFNQVIQGKPKELVVTLTNSGNVNAQNLSFNISSPLVISDLGTCLSGQLNAGSSCQITVKADPQNINQDLSVPFSISSSTLGNNSAIINFSLNARTKAILAFDQTDYLFNNGTVSSFYSKNITLTNSGPAISYDTVVNVEAPFFINSTDCTSTLNVNQSCIIEVRLNQADLASAADKKIKISNEIDTDSPEANLGFSSFQFNVSNVLGIVDRCFGPYNVSIKGSNGLISAAQNEIVNISSGNTLVYSSSSCSSGSEITSVTISNGSLNSSDFYIKSSTVGTDILLGSNSNISSGSFSFQSNAEISLNVPSPNALVSGEVLLLNPSGGYSSYTISFVDGSSTSTDADLINELDFNLDPTGNKIFTVKTISGIKTSIVRVLDSQGFYKDFTFNLYQPVSFASNITVQSNDPVSVVSGFNFYSNPNTPQYEIQNYTAPQYVSGSLFGSSIDSLGVYTYGSQTATATEYVLVKVPKVTGGFSEARIALNVLLSWPYGTLGDLYIASSQTVYLTYGQTYDYRNVTIEPGGNLIISNPNENSTSSYLITTIGISGNLVLNGNIIAPKVNLNFWNGYTWGANFNIPRNTLSDFYTVSTTFIQGEGGYGGNAVAAGGGCPSYGNGGGGGGHEGYGGSCASFSQGGRGGNGRPCGVMGIGGNGGYVGAPNGSSGTYGYNCYGGYGAGGGGGFRGAHAAPMAFKIKGTISGTGFINGQGSRGGYGGSGGAGAYYGVSGGSGAGGMGSPIWFYLRNAYSNYSNFLSMNSVDSSKISVNCSGGLAGGLFGSAVGGYGATGTTCTPQVIGF